MKLKICLSIYIFRRKNDLRENFSIKIGANFFFRLKCFHIFCVRRPQLHYTPRLRGGFHSPTGVSDPRPERSEPPCVLGLKTLVLAYYWKKFLIYTRFVNFVDHFYLSAYDENFTDVFLHDSKHFQKRLSLLKKKWVEICISKKI